MQLGEDGFHAGRPDDFGGYLAVDKVEQGGDGLDREPQAEIGIVIHIDFDDLGSSVAPGGNFVQHRSDSAARLAPGSPEANQNRARVF